MEKRGILGERDDFNQEGGGDGLCMGEKKKKKDRYCTHEPKKQIFLFITFSYTKPLEIVAES